MNEFFNIILMANASLSIREKLSVMVTTIGITIGMMLLIGGILYAVPYLAGEKNFKKEKNKKTKK